MNGAKRCRRYVKDVLSGKQPAPNYIKLACQRFNDDLERDDVDFDDHDASVAVANVEMLHHAKGRWQGKTIHLEDWQCFAVANIFGWKWTESRLRRFRYFYLRVPRKNGKSMLAICIALLFFAADEESGAEVFLGATGQEQARDILFNPAKYIVSQNKPFRDRFGIEVNASTLVIPANFSQMKAVIKKPDDGTSPNFAAVDEFHLHETNEQFAVFDTGMGAREQPLLMVTTTAGSTLGGPCHDYDIECIKVLEGNLDMDSTFAMIYAPDDSDDWADADTFRKVNPNLNVSVSEDYLLDQLKRARVSAQRQAEFRTKHCNEWVGSSTTFMNMVAWKRQERTMCIADFIGEQCHVAVDLSTQNDVSCVAATFRRDEEYYTFIHHFIPEAATQTNDRYRNFALAGLDNFETTPGNAQDYSLIKAHIEKLASQHTVLSCLFDPWQSHQMMQELIATGLNVYKFTQQPSSYSDPTKWFETLVLDGKFWHSDNDPVFTFMVGNMAVYRNGDDMIKPIKGDPNNPFCKIDAGVSAIMTLKAYQTDEEKGSLDSWLADPVVIR